MPPEPSDLDPVPALLAPPAGSSRKAPRPRMDRRLARFGAAIMLLAVGLGLFWALTRDDDESPLEAPSDAVQRAEDLAGESQLPAAQAAADVAYANEGSYANLTPESLSSLEPSFTWLPASQPAAPGQVSVDVIDGETIILVTSLPNGRCEAVFQSQEGAIAVALSSPCAADRVSTASGGHSDDSAGG